MNIPETNEPVNIPSQLQDLARYVREEIEASRERIDARRKLGEFLLNVIQDEDNRQNVLDNADAREQIAGLLAKYDAAEQAESDRFVAKFQIIEQMLTMMATLLEKGKKGVDY